MNYRLYIKTMFSVIKAYGVNIPIMDKAGVGYGHLEAITYDYKYSRPWLPKLLGDWRRANPSLSASQFEITEANTTAWLDKLVLFRPDRILFMIIDNEGNQIGHIGYSSFDFEHGTAEIDCVLRGQKTPYPMMTYALDCLIKYGYDKLKLRIINLSTMADNTKSTQLYQRCGFKIMRDIPLFKHTLPTGEIRWDEDLTKNSSETDKWGVYMCHIKEST